MIIHTFFYKSILILFIVRNVNLIHTHHQKKIIIFLFTGIYINMKCDISWGIHSLFIFIFDTHTFSVIRKVIPTNKHCVSYLSVSLSIDALWSFMDNEIYRLMFIPLSFTPPPSSLDPFYFKLPLILNSLLLLSNLLEFA